MKLRKQRGAEGKCLFFFECQADHLLVHWFKFESHRGQPVIVYQTSMLSCPLQNIDFRYFWHPEQECCKSMLSVCFISCG